MKKTREYPENPDCPLTEEEKVGLSNALDDLEWMVYQKVKHLTSGWADATVTEYDEMKVELQVTWGVDSEGWHDFDFQTIEREDLITVKKN